MQGLNVEANVMLRKNISCNMGVTYQQIIFKEPQELGTTEFLRTPDVYGFFTFDWDMTERWCFVATGQYTGSMKVAYYDQSNMTIDYEGELRKTPQFFDLGVKAEYRLYVAKLPVKLFCGVKNMLNSYQDDFETGVDRDPTYIYGPGTPRTVYAGIRISDVF